jgi:NADPH-dependent 2,4-dienoyl-CoA reductase/sulfur reductase-like enzyme/nitrite reductase/ring-hydroxylating ferredoxin subunit
MSDAPGSPLGPDLKAGFPEDRLHDRAMVRGHVDGEPVLLVRRGALVHAVGATCTHYGGSLADGIVVGDTVRCPLHHACFDLRTGAAIRAPALAPLPCYQVERRLDLIFVTRRLNPAGPAARTPRVGSAREPTRIVIIGAGAAGAAAALTLREEGYRGQITILGDEPHEPYDRPNLSKDYLAGTAAEDWLPLQPQATYADRGIRLVLGSRVSRIDAKGRTIWLPDGRTFPYEALLIATGATPVRLPLPGAELPHVHVLRSLADCRAIIAKAEAGPKALVIGAGVLGLEVASALTSRGLSVHVVAPQRRPLEWVLGPELGTRLQRLNEEHGVVFHMGRTAVQIGERLVCLDDGSVLEAGLVVIAAGVRPNTALAASAGLVLHHGILVDRFLETSIRGIFAAGDVANWPDPGTGALVRFEHWVLAERQGQTAARNMLGRLEPFEAIPFFWTQHYDVRVNYTGHAVTWDRLEILNRLPAGQWEQRYYSGERVTAVATIGRNRSCLEAELALEQRPAVKRPAPARLGQPAAGPGRAG